MNHADATMSRSRVDQRVAKPILPADWYTANFVSQFSRDENITSVPGRIWRKFLCKNEGMSHRILGRGENRPGFVRIPGAVADMEVIAILTSQNLRPGLIE